MAWQKDKPGKEDGEHPETGNVVFYGAVREHIHDLDHCRRNPQVTRLGKDPTPGRGHSKEKSPKAEAPWGVCRRARAKWQRSNKRSHTLLPFSKKSWI